MAHPAYITARPGNSDRLSGLKQSKKYRLTLRAMKRSRSYEEIHPFERSHAKTIQTDYRCAGCWEPVIVGFDKQGDFIQCDTDGCNLPGLVSAHWVEKQITQSEADAKTARKVLQELI